MDLWAGLVSNSLNNYTGNGNDSKSTSSDSEDVSGTAAFEGTTVAAYSKGSAPESLYNVRIYTNRVGPYYRVRDVTPADLKGVPVMYVSWSPNYEYAFIHVQGIRNDTVTKEALKKLAASTPQKCIKIDPSDMFTKD